MTLKVGQKIYIQRITSYAPKPKTIKEAVESLIETTVKTVGRKFFTVDKINVKFLIETMSDCSDYGNGRSYLAYLAASDLQDKLEKERLVSELRSYFDYFNRADLSLDQLRRIKEVIDENSSK